MISFKCLHQSTEIVNFAKCDDILDSFTYSNLILPRVKAGLLFFKVWVGSFQLLVKCPAGNPSIMLSSSESSIPKCQKLPLTMILFVKFIFFNYIVSIFFSNNLSIGSLHFLSNSSNKKLTFSNVWAEFCVSDYYKVDVFVYLSLNSTSCSVETEWLFFLSKSQKES